MKQVLIATVIGKTQFVASDDQAEELKKKLADGAGSLMSSTETTFSWINLANVAQIEMLEYVPPEEKPKENGEETT
jgi:hypothetical protein